MRQSLDLNKAAVGAGLRLPHMTEAVATLPAVSWFEVHPENLMSNPHAAELFSEISGRYPVSLHSVGLSVGTATGLHLGHLSRLRALAERFQPEFVSCHLAWSLIGGEYLNDLLPMPLTRESLRLVCAHLSTAQDLLGRQLLIENPASYLSHAASTIPETEFLSEVVHGTGCGLLLDVSNVCVSAHNLGGDPAEYVRRLPGASVRELHLGGWTEETDTAPGTGTVRIDTHDAPIAAEALELYVDVCRRLGPVPTLVEWDNRLPSLAELTGECIRVAALRPALSEEVAHAAAR